MNKFLSEIRLFKKLKSLDSNYRFCYLHIGNKGEWLTLEIEAKELWKIDKNRLEIVII
jgi:hypothetical protein